MKKKQVRHPRKAVVEALAAGLEEIEAHFEMEGFFPGKDGPDEEKSKNGESEPQAQMEEVDANEANSEDADEEYSEDEEYGGNSVFQREDIEVAIDVFISRLVEQRVIRRIKPGEQPSLWEIFDRFFGEDHELTQAAKVFEEHIEGYFGAIAYDDMHQAFAELSTIRDMIKREINRHAKN